MTVLHATDIAIAKGGKTYSFLFDEVTVLESVYFDYLTWPVGLMQGAVVKDDLLVADSESGGSWSTSVPIAALITPSMGVEIEWSASPGVTVDYSVDGSAWIATDNRRLIIEGSTAEVLYVRVTIPTVDDYVSYLRLEILEDRFMTSVNGGGNLLFSGTSMDFDLDHQLSFQNDSGAHIRDGYIEVQPDTDEDPNSVRTVESWMRFEGLTTGTIFSAGSATMSVSGTTVTFSGMTVYRNGIIVSSGASFPLSTWAHWVFVLPANINQTIRFQGVLSVGHLATYDYDMTAAQVANIYSYNVSGNDIRIADSSAIVVTEPVDPLDIYAYNWSGFAG